MKSPMRWLALTLMALPLLALTVFTALHYPLLSLGLIISSVLLMLICAWSAVQLVGSRNAAIFAALGLSLGWFAEQMGSSRGWFFGRYVYTDVLGPRLGDVPWVIPLMWFALCWVGYVLAQLILWRQPVGAGGMSWPRRFTTALLAAMLVTAFDLGADPYFVFVLKAWVMQKTDGGWFGETLQGFAGWMLISWLIVLIVQWLMRDQPQQPRLTKTKVAAALPLGIYASAMVFQLLLGHPIATRAVALFAMGIPLLAAAVAWWQWQRGQSS